MGVISQIQAEIVGKATKDYNAICGYIARYIKRDRTALRVVAIVRAELIDRKDALGLTEDQVNAIMAATSTQFLGPAIEKMKNDTIASWKSDDVLPE